MLILASLTFPSSHSVPKVFNKEFWTRFSNLLGHPVEYWCIYKLRAFTTLAKSQLKILNRHKQIHLQWTNRQIRAQRYAWSEKSRFRMAKQREDLTRWRVTVKVSWILGLKQFICINCELQPMQKKLHPRNNLYPLAYMDYGNHYQSDRCKWSHSLDMRLHSY